VATFSDIVWVIPILYGLIFVIGLTVGRSHQKIMVTCSTLLSVAAFVIAVGIMWERTTAQAEDYSFYFDWLVIGNTFYRIGYELNNVAAWLLILMTGVNILLLCLLYRKQDQPAIASIYGYMGLLLFAASGVVLADHVLTFFACGILVSCSIYLLLSHPIYGCKPKAAFRYITAQLAGYALFLAALVSLYWYMPNHSLEFTMLETIFSGSALQFTIHMKNIIAGALVASALFIAGMFPYGHWMKHVELERPILKVVIFCFGSALMPMYILLRFQAIITESDDILSLCKWIGALVVIWCTLRMLTRAQEALAYIGMTMVGVIVFSYGHGAYMYMIAQLTFIMLSLIVIYGSTLQTSSIIVFGAFLVAVLTLIGVPPLSGYWMQQSLVATIATQSSGWTAAALLVIMCSALGVTISFTTYWKKLSIPPKHGVMVIVIWPALLLIGLGLGWLVDHSRLERWLFDQVTMETMKLIPMLLTMLSVAAGVIIAWLFSERLTEALSNKLGDVDQNIHRFGERLGTTIKRLGRFIVGGGQLIERAIVQVLTVWLPFPFRTISRAGVQASVLQSIGLVIVITVLITALWYGLRGR